MRMRQGVELLNQWSGSFEAYEVIRQTSSFSNDIFCAVSFHSCKDNCGGAVRDRVPRQNCCLPLSVTGISAKLPGAVRVIYFQRAYCLHVSYRHQAYYLSVQSSLV